MTGTASFLMGQGGSTDIAAATGTKTYTITGPHAIQAINGAAVTFTSITDGHSANNLLTSLGAGQVVYGNFTTIDVATGTLRAYFQ